MPATIVEATNAQLDLQSVAVKGPLSGLDETPGLAIIRYPQDLAAPSKSGKNNKNHWVTFTIQDVQPASVGTANTTQQTKIQTTGGLATDIVVGTLVTAAVTKAQKGSDLPGAAKLAIGTAGGIIAGILNEQLSKGLAVSPQLTTSQCSISLYMPDNLVANYSASYEEMSLTSDLGPTITTLRAVTSLVGKDGGNDIGSNPDTITAVTGIANVFGIEVPGVDTTALGTLLQRAQGYAINPQIQMVYRGSPLREFSLTFKLTPRSKEEANKINDIINRFKFYASPSLGQKNGNVTESTTNSMYLIPPSIFQVQFYVNGEESGILPKYGDCALLSVEVNHAPNGFAAYVDGSMVQTELTLAFKELNILTRDNFTDTDTASIRR